MWTSTFPVLFFASLVSYCFYIIGTPCRIKIWSSGHLVLYGAKKKKSATLYFNNCYWYHCCIVPWYYCMIVRWKTTLNFTAIYSWLFSCFRLKLYWTSTKNAILHMCENKMSKWVKVSASSIHEIKQPFTVRPKSPLEKCELCLWRADKNNMATMSYQAWLKRERRL